jgi:antibiotic biosynthesis monooxygenase (ABM) superfamily enzyme
MTTMIIFHEVDDVAHWLASPKRKEVFGARGIAIRTFVDPTKTNRVGLIAEIPDMAAFQKLMASPEAAEAMKIDGVRPATLVSLVES